MLFSHFTCGCLRIRKNPLCILALVLKIKIVLNLVNVPDNAIKPTGMLLICFESDILRIENIGKE